MKIRYTFYLIVVGGYILFGILKSFDGIWPWGAVMLGVPIIAAEVFTRISIWKRNK